MPFLIVYYGSDGAGGWQALDRPLRTLTTLDRFGAELLAASWEGPGLLEPRARRLAHALLGRCEDCAAPLDREELLRRAAALADVGDGG